jgi:PAS domain-containing protein
MSVVVPIIDFAALMTFVAAAALLLTVSSDESSPLSDVAKWCIFAAMLVYAFAMGSNVLEHSGVTAALDPIEDYMEMLFPPLVLYGAYAVYFRQREHELLASQHATQASQQMMLTILDAAPAGILVLDSTGHLTFANDEAKDVLGLTEDDHGVLTTPGWTVRVADEVAADFAPLLHSSFGSHGVPVLIEWPQGAHARLSVRTEMLRDPAGDISGLVAAFIRPPGTPVTAAGPE